MPYCFVLHSYAGGIEQDICCCDTSVCSKEQLPAVHVEQTNTTVSKLARTALSISIESSIVLY